MAGGSVRQRGCASRRPAAPVARRLGCGGALVRAGGALAVGAVPPVARWWPSAAFVVFPAATAWRGRRLRFGTFPRLFLVLVGVRSGAGDELVGSSCVSRRRFGEMALSLWNWILQTSLSFAGVCSGAGVGSVSFFRSFDGLFGFSCSCGCLSRVELQRYRDVPVAYGVFR